jgi:hypothetical protein
MANWANPTLTSNYTNFVTEVKDRDTDAAVWFEGVTPTNTPTNAKRLNTSTGRFEKWNGTAWVDAVATFTFPAVTVAGATTLNGNVTLGDAAGDTVTITGTPTFSAPATFSNATSPIISAKIGPVAGQQHTVPAVTSDTIALLAATQTLTNKTYSGGTNSGTQAGNHTLSGQVTFSDATAPIITAKLGPSTTQQHAMPAVASDTVALLAATQTFTNKTLTSPTVTGGTINNTPIGATTANSGAFTSLAASGQVTFSGTGAATMNAGTTAQRPTGVTGMFRFNSSLGKFEGYNGSAWGAVGGGATGGGSDDIFIENGQTVTTNYTITSGKNAMSAGPITIANGIVVTVPSGSVWTIV